MPLLGWVPSERHTGGIRLGEGQCVEVGGAVRGAAVGGVGGEAVGHRGDQRDGGLSERWQRTAAGHRVRVAAAPGRLHSRGFQSGDGFASFVSLPICRIEIGCLHNNSWARDCTTNF
jgi:hypothetical protein